MTYLRLLSTGKQSNVSDAKKNHCLGRKGTLPLICLTTLNFMVYIYQKFNTFKACCTIIQTYHSSVFSTFVFDSSSLLVYPDMETLTLSDLNIVQ